MFKELKELYNKAKEGIKLIDTKQIIKIPRTSNLHDRETYETLVNKATNIYNDKCQPLINKLGELEEEHLKNLSELAYKHLYLTEAEVERDLRNYQKEFSKNHISL